MVWFCRIYFRCVISWLYDVSWLYIYAVKINNQVNPKLYASYFLRHQFCNWWFGWSREYLPAPFPIQHCRLLRKSHGSGALFQPFPLARRNGGQNYHPPQDFKVWIALVRETRYSCCWHAGAAYSSFLSFPLLYFTFILYFLLFYLISFHFIPFTFLDFVSCVYLHIPFLFFLWLFIPYLSRICCRPAPWIEP